jgi:DNA-binding HxlR family transcriptional regulator
MRTVKESSTNNHNRKAIMGECPVSYTLEKIGGRWKPLILWHLKDGAKRYSELKKSIPAITEKMLIQHLKQLEEDQLLLRKVVEVMPPHVEYKLSRSGKGLMLALNAMAEWGQKNSR